MISSRQSLRSKAPICHEIENPEEEVRCMHTSTLFEHYIITIGGSFKETEDISIFNLKTYEWQRAILTGHMLEPRIGHTARLFNQNKIIVYGGPIEQPSNEAFIITISPENNRFTLDCEEIISEEEDPCRCYHSAEVFAGKMYVFGGLDGQYQKTNELWSLDLKDHEWTKCAQKGDIPSARLTHTSVLISNKMYVFGGRNNTEPYVRTNSLYSLDLETLYWSEVQCTGMAPSPRNSMSLVEHSGSLYLFGGQTGQIKASNELFSLNLNDDKKWKKVDTKNQPPPGRYDHTMSSYENKIFILGGENEEEDLYNVWCIDFPLNYKENKLANHAAQMSKLYLNSMYSDVTFIVQGEKICGHKILLGTGCTYFFNMFFGEMMESNQKEIEIKDCKAATFKALLRYIYCYEIDFTEDLALDLFVFCNNRLLKELEEECEDYLAENLTIENVLERAQLANQFDAAKLMSSIVQFVIEKMPELEQRGDLYKMPSVINVKVMFELKNRAEKTGILHKELSRISFEKSY